MAEEITVREAARRLGVSDTALNKERAKPQPNRVCVARYTESGRPMIDWEETQRRWLEQSDVSKRSHVGSQGGKKRAGEKPVVKLPTSDNMDAAPVLSAQRSHSPMDHSKHTGNQKTETNEPVEESDGRSPESGRGGKYAQARGIREVYQAKMAQLDYEEAIGKLINADEAKIAWSKMVTAARNKIMGIPATCKTRISDLPLSIVSTIDSVCREVLEDLANGNG